MADQDWGSEQYVSEQFQRYYASNARRIEAPPAIEQREFGFLSFMGKTMFRHMGFQEPRQLRDYLMRYAPAHTYFSAAYYEYPAASMAEKGWLGADLVFDIDADHFDLPCQKTHDRWTCATCGNQGTGHSPVICTRCGKATFIEENWLCNNCLDAAKNEARKLLDILVQDFGFIPSEEVSVNFSGNRGYHVHVRSSTIKEIDQPARREIVDYILGIGIETEYQGLKLGAAGESILSQGGWRNRTVRALYDFIANATHEQMQELKLSRKSVKNILETRVEILDTLIDRSPREIFKHISTKSLEKIMSVAIDEQASAIDTVVTTDLRRLIRLPNTLHGKSGWLTQKVPFDDLIDYDPLSEAIAFTEGTETVYVKRAPEIRIGDETYGPYEDQRVELPLAVVMFLLGRKVARLDQ